MEKYQNKTPVMRFIHKYTGFIVCFSILAVAVPLYIMETEKQLFFEKWSCSKIQRYLLLENTGKFPIHDELSKTEHVRMHEIITECDFPPLVKHD